MSWSVALAVLVGALLHACWNVLVKAGTDRQRDTVTILTGAAVIAAGVLPFLPRLAYPCIPYLVTSVVIHVGYFLLVASAYRVGDLSLVYPLMRGTAPAMTALVATTVLQESLPPLGWAGLLLVCGGALLLVVEARKTSGSAIALSLGNAAVVVLYTLVDGLGARLSGHALAYTGWMLLLTGFVVVVYAFVTDRSGFLTHLRGRCRIGLLGGACMVASYALALWAMTYAPIGLVAALRETSIIFGVMLAWLVLKESVKVLRWISIVTIASGGLLIKVC
ncbi:MAG: EamA family transporter [Planctomycetes bacterium]|nr:EamA family transporter [Planctomycetota bacterium]